MEKKDLVIAIDGPAASGKSTAAAEVARRLRIAYISTGSLYRAVAWAMLRRKCSVVTADFLDSLHLMYCDRGNGYEVCVDGVYPGAELRTAEVAAGASAVATLPLVRAFLLDLQRGFAGPRMIVMEGRDIGTVIFPNAKYKFFVTASAEARARRRLAQRGEAAGETLESMMLAIAARDQQDSTRAVAPLRQAPDAILIDSSNLTREQVLEQIINNIDRRDYEALS